MTAAARRAQDRQQAPSDLARTHLATPPVHQVPPIMSTIEFPVASATAPVQKEKEEAPEALSEGREEEKTATGECLVPCSCLPSIC